MFAHHESPFIAGAHCAIVIEASYALTSFFTTLKVNIAYEMLAWNLLI